MTTRRWVWGSIFGLALTGLLVLMNNCSRTGLDSSTVESIDMSSAFSGIAGADKLLAGTGVVRNPVPNCVVKTDPDFMDAVMADHRRIEPIDCTVVNVSTPVFSWPLPLDLPAGGNMHLQITSSANKVVYRDVVVPRAMMLDPLPAGDYAWTVSYTDKNGNPQISLPRHFNVPTTSLLAIPAGSAFLQLVYAKSRPRLLNTSRTFAQIDSMLRAGEYSKSYADFLGRAETFKNDPYQVPSKEPDVPPKYTQANFATKALYDSWAASVVSTAQREVMVIETLAFAARLTSNLAYEQAAMRRALKLAQWDVNGPTSEALQDQYNRKIYQQLGLALDLFQDKYTSDQRKTIVDSLKNRVTQTMDKYSQFDTDPYDSHLVTATMFVVEALMYAVGTPEFTDGSSRPMLFKAWETAITMASAWGGSQDGGFGNGNAYGWANMGNVARYMTVVRLVSGVNLARWSALARFGDNQIAFTAPNSQLMSPMGDAIEDKQLYMNNAWQDSRLLAAVTANPEYEWYWRQDPRGPNMGIWVPPVHYMLYGALSVAPQAPTTTPTFPNSYLFPDTGMAAFHSDTKDPNRSSVFFRSSRFGSFNHSHADNNAFTFYSHGKEIFISGGYYPAYLSPHHKLVGRATRFKNALTYNGGIGQAEPMQTPIAPGSPDLSMEASGRILNFSDDGTWSVVTGDATLAYRSHTPNTDIWTPQLNDAVRTVIYNRKLGLVLIYDFASSDLKRTWELNFQSPGTLDPTKLTTIKAIKTGAQSIKVLNETSSACLNIWGPAGSFADPATGFPADPAKDDSTKAWAPEYHSRYTVTSPTKQFAAVTIIKESCAAGINVQVHISDTGAAQITVTTSAGSTVLTADRRTVTLP